MSEAFISNEEISAIFERAELLKSGKIIVYTGDQVTIDKFKEALEKPIYSLGEETKNCSWGKKLRCAALLAAAVSACGDPDNIPGIITVLGTTAADCIDCL
jgi:Cu2+-containing amine oxidase